ncbi:MAG: hypothetical protein IJ588_03660, partial [Prevotella sp.]|nr:hypothetical protein [Prevotella sp.]
TFEGWFCSTKLLDFPFFAIALFCTVQFWWYRISVCVSVVYKIPKHFRMNSSPIKLGQNRPKQTLNQSV